MNAFSVGPWKVVGESGNDAEAEIIENKDRTIAWTAASLNLEGENYISEEDKANAQLIAVAPQLLAGLQEAVKKLDELAGTVKRTESRYRHLWKIIDEAKKRRAKKMRITRHVGK